MILWQSFGFFDPSGNDQVLSDVSRVLRSGGRLLLGLFNPGYFEAHQGRTRTVRDPRCRAITNSLDGSRLTSTIEYVGGTAEIMDWDQSPPPTADEQRFQIVLQKD